jgi:AcrR family transcriptional regulator
MSAATVKEAAPERRQYLRSPERRTQIVEVAIELMADRGLAEVSIRDVAGAAGVPISSITYHFGSRDELLRAVMEAMIAKFCDRMVAAGPGATGLDEVLAGYRNEIAAGTGYGPGHHALLIEFTLYASRRPETSLARRQYESYEEAGSRVIDAICARTGTTFVGDRAPVVRLLIALLEGMTLQQLASGDPHSAQPVLAYLDQVLRLHLMPAGAKEADR